MRIDRGPGDLASPWLLAAGQRHNSGYIACNHHEIRYPDWIDGSPVWAAWPLGILATRVLSGFIPPNTLTGPVAKGGGRWLGRRQDPSCLEPLPFKQSVCCPPTSHPLPLILYISSELAVAVQSLVNDALLLLTALQSLDFTRSTIEFRRYTLARTCSRTVYLFDHAPRPSKHEPDLEPTLESTSIPNCQTSPCCPRLLPWPSPPPSSRPRLTLFAILLRRVRCDAP